METPGGRSVPSFYGKKDDLNEQFSYRAVEGARVQTTHTNLLRRQKRFPTQKVRRNNATILTYKCK